MEAQQSQGITDKEQRNKTLSAGRGGAPIAGLLVFGGALAVTGLIAAASFVTRRNKAKPSPQQSHHTSQDSTANHHNACCETSNTTKDQLLSCESLPSQTSILEDKPDLKVETYVEEDSTPSLYQEIVLSDDSSPESTVSFNDNGVEEDGVESSADSPSSEEVDQSEPQEPLNSVEINDGQHDNDSATTETEDHDVEEDGVESSDDSPSFEEVDQSQSKELLKSVEINEGQLDNDSAMTETEDNIVEEDDIVALETSENSSEATGRTSLDSSEAAIWPAMLIEEEEPQQMTGEMVNEQSEAEGTAESNISHTDDKSYSGANISESFFAGNDRVMASAKANYSEQPNLYEALNYSLSGSNFKIKTSVILLLLFAILLLVLLTHRNRISGSLTVAIL